MSRKIIVLLLFLLSFRIYSFSQNDMNFKYDNTVKEAYNSFDLGFYDESIKNFKLAIRLANDFNFDSKEADLGLLKVIEYKRKRNEEISNKLLKDKEELEFLQNQVNSSSLYQSSSKKTKLDTLTGRKIIVYKPITYNDQYPSSKLSVNFDSIKISCSTLINKLKNYNSDSLYYDYFNYDVIKKIEKKFYSIDNNNVTRLLYDSINSVINLNNVNDEILFIRLRAALHYGWGLLDNKSKDLRYIDSARYVIQSSINLFDNNQIDSSLILFGLSGLENLLSQYYSQIDDNVNSYKHNLLSIKYAINAVELEPYNVYYSYSLCSYLQNSKYLPDSILPKKDKNQFKLLASEISNNFKYKNLEDPNELSLKLRGVLYKVNILINSGEFKDAIPLLNDFIMEIEDQKKIHGNSFYLSLFHARLFKQLAYIDKLYDNDSDNLKKYVDLMYTNLQYVIKSRIDSKRYLFEIENVYDGIVTYSKNTYDNQFRSKLFEGIIESIKGGYNDYLSLESLAYVYVNANNEYSDYLLKVGNRNDSLQAIFNISNSIEVLESTINLDKYFTFSEDFNKFISIFTKSVEININFDNFIMAKRYYDKMCNLFLPIIKKYNYDFYLKSSFSSISRKYGKFLFEKDKFSEAIIPLEFASFEGDKKSTEYLIEIYQDENFIDTINYNMYVKRLSYQSNSKKKFTVPTSFGDTKFPFDVYVVDRDPEYPYKGIDDQVEWIKIARGGFIPETVSDAFKKIQALAWKNSVKFTELSVYALESANESKITDPLDSLQILINNENKLYKKDSMYQYLNHSYNNKLTDPNNDFLIDNAVDFKLDYADFLFVNKIYPLAQDIYFEILALDSANSDALNGVKSIEFSVSHSNINDVILSENVNYLFNYFKLFLSINDTVSSKLIVDKILRLDPDIALRSKISEFYLLKTGKSNFIPLFLSDDQLIDDFRNHFLSIKSNSLSNNSLKINHFSNLLLLDKKFLELNPSDSINIKKDMSNHYNSLGWFNMLSKNYDNILFYFSQSYELDSSNVYAIGNMPHAFLFNNQFEKAKELYLTLKDLSFNESAGYPTYKDAFLSDFNEFKTKGIIHEDLDKMIAIIENSE